MTIAKIIGKKIASLRKSKRISQAELADLADLDRSFISEIENGKKNISINVLEKIARALDTTMAKLLDEQNNLEE